MEHHEAPKNPLESPRKSKHIVIVAGEASGDMHAAHLIEAIRRLDPQITFSGLGGQKMKENGVEIYSDLTKIAVVGFGEVLKHYGEFKAVFQLIVKKINEIRPLAVILVDYPGFNLRLAKKIKKKNIKVIYYISPQVWAWKKKRVYLIKKVVNQMLVLFQFEKDFYARYQIPVDFVGHPLIDNIKINSPKESFLETLGLTNYKLTVGLLPGSREKEVERHLPMMLEAAKILHKEFPMMQFILIKAPTISGELISQHIASLAFSLKVAEDEAYDAINACDVCMVASGTATLETAILQKPMVVIYKTSLLTWLLARLFVKIPDIGLVNVVAGKRIVPECVQFQATGEQIAKELKSIFTDELKIAEIKSELKKVKESLGPGGASERAAKAILKSLF